LAGYEPHAWFEFGVGIIGAAAALSGLLFVAMSINIERILALGTLPPRAAGNLVLFALPLLLGTWMLIPEQPRVLLGVELVGTGLLAGALMLWLHRPSHRVEGEARTSWLLGSYLPSVVVAGLTVVGGATLIAGQGGGLYWVAPAVFVSFATGLVGAWVLLVEILR
jgi:modulator of FtsH protease